MNIRNLIKKDLILVLKKLGLPFDNLEISRTIDPKHGDYSTNIALRFAEGKQGQQKIGNSSLEIAKKITESMQIPSYVEKLEVAGSGFINIYIKKDVWQKEVQEVLKIGKNYGGNEAGRGKKARVEFVSANPTGPLHFGNARGGPIGDVLASVLEFSGYKVLREYYHNDIGGQVDKLGESIWNVMKGAKLEDQEYKGLYVAEFAKKLSDSKDAAGVGKKAVEILLKEAIADSEKMGIEFDKIYNESEFIDSGKTDEVIRKLGKFLKVKDGARWFAPSDKFLDDRETVVVKSDGSHTYFANDIAYHDLKFSENPDLVIDIFGSNHHGHIPRLQAAISALRYDERKFHVILYQWVRFKRGGEVVKMSKRAGTFITAREVLDEIGRDAVRFFILMHDANSPIDFDLDLAREKSKKNPVYYVQYANARICSILAKAGPVSSFLPASARSDQRSSDAEKNNPDLRSVGSLPTAATRFDLLVTNYELDLIRQITRLPELVEDISKSFAVHRLTGYATELADAFHKFYENCRVVGEEKELEQARIALLLATQVALKNTLRLLGVSAPENM